ncbi:isoprenoid biosynthesis glyoxalase ElbB [Vibrio sp. 05-20-BW147]|uniref:isoprenoid biosynthesis glyoxalase ElbB n=1 Tax=Vibrio sp. 05-20-BW147 TaxID=2575834 RepID=UPI001592CA55|nr:isoprenoid biosynthesis glyoxalase ElbB [Vibrio sp. 05-20-BW147]NVC61692.1 isoprenoid biosynthesis glyoxalase ElbB [Vibrio sp. 05-20-BW147]
MKKVAVILSGCGVYDGAEIHEAVLALLAIEKAGANWHCFAPNVDQLHVINHKTGEEMSETRNVLVESARIARGNIDDVVKLNVEEFDALLLPGGFGAAKNLSNFAISGAECRLNQDVEKACKAFALAGKPAGYLCIAPVMLPLIYGAGIGGTVGNDAATAAAFNQMGGDHKACDVDEICHDAKHNVFSTPAYMLAGSIREAASGIDKLISALVEAA